VAIFWRTNDSVAPALRWATEWPQRSHCHQRPCKKALLAVALFAIMTQRTMQISSSLCRKVITTIFFLIVWTWAVQAQQVSTNQIQTKSSTTDVAGKNADIGKEERFSALKEQIRVMQGNSTRNWDEFEKTARQLIKEFPDQPDGYEALMIEMQVGSHNKAQALAQEMADSSAPENFKLWAKGFLYRMEQFGKPVDLRFIALDGREVNLAKMRGKVVLIEFWGTGCVPCVAELPDIKAAYNKYHDQGFEVIGISFDTNKAKLTRFIKDRDLPWPQSFEGKQGIENKFGQEFGVCAIPHLMLLDKEGCLRLDGFYPWQRFEIGISNLVTSAP
jgi:peroxiredoxin